MELVNIWNTLKAYILDMILNKIFSVISPLAGLVLTRYLENPFWIYFSIIIGVSFPILVNIFRIRYLLETIKGKVTFRGIRMGNLVLAESFQVQPIITFYNWSSSSVNFKIVNEETIININGKTHLPEEKLEDLRGIVTPQNEIDIRFPVISTEGLPISLPCTLRVVYEYGLKDAKFKYKGVIEIEVELKKDDKNNSYFLYKNLLSKYELKEI